MKKLFLLFVLFLFIISLGSWKSDVKIEEAPHKNLKKWILSELNAMKTLFHECDVLTCNELKLKTIYRSARKHYKHIEFFVEYCNPKEAKYYINGPLVPKYNEELEYSMIDPHGFQKIEELIFSGESPLDTENIHLEIKQLEQYFDFCINYYRTLELREEQLLEMCQIHFLRIASLSLNGYDATYTKVNITETATSLYGIEKTLNEFDFFTQKSQKVNSSLKQCKKMLKKAIKHLNSNPDYDHFDRLAFITDFINPLNRLVIQLHNDCHLPWSTNKSALNLQEPFLFGKESYNMRYFSMYYNDTLLLDKQAELGKKLFFDPILSGNKKQSCATCHQPDKAFTDGLKRSLTLDGNDKELRNAPSLLNVVFQKAFFYDGKAYQLEQQVFDVVHNQKEMGGDFEKLIHDLRKISTYRELFSTAFTGTCDTSITAYSISKAITEYEKTLVSFNSRFDIYLRGDKTSLTKQEINGYNLFAGKALCASCHFFPLFNGTVPPFYNDTEFEVIGVPVNKDNKKLDYDKGRYIISHFKEHSYSFKTPSLRNIEKTAPYMHNGVYDKLEEVVEFYHRGGGRGFDFDLENQTLPFDSLNLNNNEKKDLVLFLKSLTDLQY